MELWSRKRGLQMSFFSLSLKLSVLFTLLRTQKMRLIYGSQAWAWWRVNPASTHECSYCQSLLTTRAIYGSGSFSLVLQSHESWSRRLVRSSPQLRQATTLWILLLPELLSVYDVYFPPFQGRYLPENAYAKGFLWLIAPVVILLQDALNAGKGKRLMTVLFMSSTIFSSTQVSGQYPKNMVHF